MSTHQWSRIEDLLAAARKVEPRRRAAYLAESCGGDDDLRARVESLLATDSIGAGEMSVLAALAPAHFGPGSRLGPYQLEALLGEGGMGQVYRARDTRLGRLVAIKLIRAEGAHRADFQIRFQREAQATAALNHSHICALYDVGELHGAAYLVMEFVEGQTLASRLREGPLPLDQLLHRAVEVAQALVAAHERGIIHRDLKPANLIVTSAGIKVLDFGLAKFISPEPEAREATVGRAILGTPAYMSPEQARGEELDPRSDLFSFGCVLYEAATGVRPFRGSSLPETLREVASGHPPPPSSLRPELPSGWDAIVMRSLAKDRDRRYQTAADLLSAIQELRGGTTQPVSRMEERQPDPVFGREKETAKLEELLRSTILGKGRVVLVSGEPGIGKTALTRTFVYQARKNNPDLVLARGACVEQYGTGEAYLPFLDALGSLLLGSGRERAQALLRRHAPTWCLQLPAVFSSGAMDQILRETTGATKDRMLRELGDVFAELTAESPVLLVLEDMHWTDPASVDMLRHLAERASSQKLLLLVTARPEDVERSNPTLKKCYTEMHARGVCEEIPLRALRVEDVAAYLDAHFVPHELPAGLAVVIHRKSEGHPLFATGAIQILAERGDLTRTDGVWKLKQPLDQTELDVPVSVRSMIEKKVRLLNDEQRQALQYASIEGEVFTSTVLAALLEADELELEERLDVLAKVHQLIRTEGEDELPDGSVTTVYRFTHALYQHFLYDQLLSKRRALLHRRAGETMERVYAGQNARIAGALATHFERGRDFSKAVTYLLQAGDTALSRYAHAEAVKYYSHGLDLVDKLAEAARPEQQIVLFRKRAVSLLALGQLKESFADYIAMRRLCQISGYLEEECRALIGLTTVAYYLRELDDLDQYGQAAMALAERIGNPALTAEAGINCGIYLGGAHGRLSEAQSYYEKSLPLARSVGHKTALPAGLMYSGLVHFWKSEYEAAERTQMEACQVATEVRDGFYQPLALLYLGLTRANRGRISEAMEAMQEAFDLAKRNNHGVVLARAPNAIGWVWREIGDLSKAIEFNQGCVEVSRKARAAEAEANGLINLVYAYLEADEPARAAESLEGVQPLYERERWARWRFYGIRHRAAEAQYWLSRRKLDRAEEHARTLLNNAEQNGVPKYIAVARRLLGEIAVLNGDAVTAEAELIRSLESFHTHPTPLIEWRNQAALGRLLAARNRPASATEAFKRAEILVRDIADNIVDLASRNVFLQMAATREVIARAAG